MACPGKRAIWWTPPKVQFWDVHHGIVVPRVIAEAGDKAARRFLEFFAATIRNKNTRTAYYHAVVRFFAWCDRHKIGEIADIEPLHVAAYIEALGKDFEKPTVKQHLAAIRMLFDWLVTGQVVATNPAHAVRGPKHVVKTGKTTVLTGEQARELLDSIDISTVVGLRDRALISVMTFAFAASAPSSPCASRTTTPRASAGGCVCLRKAASGMRCRRITIWKPISTPI
jgi:Phage integrase, N-terminal SAM-like domain